MVAGAVDVMVVSVDEVLVIVLVVAVVPVADVSVVLIVPVVPVAEVSVAIVVLVEVVALMEVSVVAVSVLTFSSFFQPKAKMATATRARRVTSRDFFIFTFLLRKFADLAI